MISTLPRTPAIFCKWLLLIKLGSLTASTPISWFIEGLRIGHLSLSILTRSVIIILILMIHTKLLHVFLWGFISALRSISEDSWTHSISKLIGSQLGLMSSPKWIISLCYRLIHRWLIILFLSNWFGEHLLLLNQRIVIFVDQGHVLLRDKLCNLPFRSPTLICVLPGSAIQRSLQTIFILYILDFLFLRINFIFSFLLSFSQYWLISKNILQKLLHLWVIYHAKDSREIFLLFLIVFLLFRLNLLLVLRFLLLRRWSLISVSLLSRWILGIRFDIFIDFRCRVFRIIVLNFLLLYGFGVSLFLFLLFLCVRFDLGLFRATI